MKTLILSLIASVLGFCTYLLFFVPLGGDQIALSESTLSESAPEEKPQPTSPPVKPQPRAFEDAIADPELSYHTLIREFIRSEPETLLSYLDSLKHYGDRQKAIGLFLMSITTSVPDYVEMADRAFDLLPPGKTRDLAAVEFISRIVKDDITSAEAWRDTLPEGALKEAIGGALIAPLANRDPDAYFAHLESLGWKTEIDSSIGGNKQFVGGKEQGSGASYPKGSYQHSLAAAARAIRKRDGISASLAKIADIPDYLTWESILSHPSEEVSKAAPDLIEGFNKIWPPKSVGEGDSGL